MKTYSSLTLMAAALLLATPGAALAYIGPATGTGAIAALLGVLGSIFLAIFAVIWYPIKRMLKGKKKPQKAPSDTKVG